MFYCDFLYNIKIFRKNEIRFTAVSNLRKGHRPGSSCCSCAFKFWKFLWNKVVLPMKWISHFLHFSLLYVVYSNFRLDSFQTNLLYFELKGCDRGMLFSFWMNLNRPHLLKSRFSGNCSVLLCCFIKNMLAIKNTKNLVPNRKFLYAKVTPKSQRFSLEYKKYFELL